LAAAGLAGGAAFAKAFAPVAIAAAVIGIGVATTKMAADYQSATTLLVTGAGESESAIGQVRQGLLDMAPAVGMGPTALAKAMFLVESAGFHGAAGLTVMAAAAQGAKVGGADATVVADGLTTAMTDYHYSADQANTVTSKLVQTVALGKTNMGDLSGALSNVLPFAANLKISFNDVMGAMATMTSQGIDASRASTMLKFGMMALANETPKGASALYSIGLTTQDVVTALGAKGLSGTIAMVTDAIGKKFPAGSAEAVAALSDIFGGTRGIGMALALGGQNAATFTANIKSIAAAVPEANGAVKGWSLTQEDLNTQLDQVGAFMSSVAIKLGTVL
ncbi:MAG TPA: phage tail tape measure protein, partial [Candidatus Limnocylindrales bacterium]